MSLIWKMVSVISVTGKTNSALNGFDFVDPD